MNKKFFPALIAPAACLLLFACGTSSDDRDFSDVPDPRDPFRQRLEEYIRNYVQPEIEIPVVYAEEQKEDPEYWEYELITRKYYTSLPFFKKNTAIKKIALEYQNAAKDTFSLNAERILDESGKTFEKKISFALLKNGAKAPAFQAAASIPDVTAMPAGVPREREEAVSREMNLIFQFLMPDDPEILPRAVSLQMAEIVNAAQKKVRLEPQEYPMIADRTCCLFKVSLREMFGGGSLFLYAATDSTREIRRIVLPALALDPQERAFTVTIKSYKPVNGFLFPDSFEYAGSVYTLVKGEIEALPVPTPPVQESVKAEEKPAEAAEPEAPAEKKAEEKTAPEKKTSEEGDAEEED